MPAGMLGSYKGEDRLTSLLRKIAVKYSQDKGEWAEKYGTDFENEDFMMIPFCWCGKCPVCDGIVPNFLHIKTGFEVRWYKYIGRDMETNKKPPFKELKKLL